MSFGNFDTTAVNQTVLRRDVAFLGQSAGIFAGTVRDNLTFGDKSISDDSIVEKMSLTGMDYFKRIAQWIIIQLVRKWG